VSAINGNCLNCVVLCLLCGQGDESILDPA